MTFQQYLHAVFENQEKHPEWRPGQTYYNTLSEVNLGLVQNVIGTAADCYDRDDHIAAFLERVYRYYEAFGSVTDERRSNI